jgi:hypothetical protein
MLTIIDPAGLNGSSTSGLIVPPEVGLLSGFSQSGVNPDTQLTGAKSVPSATPELLKI